MSFTYDTTTSRGQVRLIIGDTDTVTAANQIFSDAEIDAFLSMEGSVVKLAAACALEAIASKQAYIQKVITVGDLKTDGAKLAAEFRAQAAGLRAQVEDQPAYDWLEQSVTPAVTTEIIIKDAMRGG